MRFKLDPLSPSGISLVSDTSVAMVSTGVSQSTADRRYVLKAGDTMSGDLIVPDEVYSASWDASLEVPTKNAIYDKIEAVVLADGDVNGPTSATDNAIARYDGTTGKIIQNSGVFIDDNGNVGIGVTPTNRFTSKGLGASTGVNLQTTTSADTPTLTVLDNGNTIIGSPTSSVVTEYNNSSATPNFQILSTGANASFLMYRYAANTLSGRIFLLKTRGTTPTDYAAVLKDDTLGEFAFGAGNGTEAADGAHIRAYAIADQSGSAYTATTIAFDMSPNGTNSVSEMFTFWGDARLGIGDTLPQYALSVNGSGLIADDATIGSEKVTNPNFTGSATSWTLASGWAYNTNNVIKNADGTGTLSQAVGAVAGEIYRVGFTISSWTVGSVTVSVGGTTCNISQTKNLAYVVHLKASTTGDLIFTPSNTARFVIDTISVKKITGGNLDIAGELLTSGSTTARASMNIPSGTAPSSPVEGDMWSDSTQKAMVSYSDGVKQVRPGVLFTQTADVTVTNTTTETSILGTGVGTKTLPANFFVAGKTIRIRVGGVYSTTAITGGTATVKIKYGSTVLATVATTSLLAGASSLEFDGEALITCRTTGGSGTVMTHGDIEYSTGLVGTIAVDSLNNGGAITTIDTTASSALDVTVTWGTAASTLIAKSTVSVIEVLN